MTIKEIDKKMNDIENYYNLFNMCSYEYPTEIKRQESMGWKVNDQGEIIG